MTPNAWLVSLLRASIEGGVLLLIVWALTRAWPRMPAAARCGLWWLGALRMIAGLLPIPTVPVPWTWGAVPLPRTHAWPATLPTPLVEFGNAMAGAAAPATAAGATHALRLDVIPLAVVALWLTGVLIGLVLLARRVLAVRRSWRSARSFDDPRIARWRNEWAVVLGRGRVPEVRASAETRAPVAIGALRPGLLLPQDSARLSDDALRVVLAHEMSHVRRGDLLFAWVPAAAQLLFWFHPLVRFAVREYLAAREEVCDADALRATGVSPRDYGALLVDYGVVRMSEVPGAACCGSRASRDLKRRLDMLSRTVRVSIAHRAGAIAITLAVLVLGFAPIRFVSAEESSGDREYKRAVELYRADELKRKRAYSDAEASTRDQREAAEKAYAEATGEKAYKHSYDRPENAYAIKIRGQKGTRGSVGMVDMEPLRALDYEDESVVYFRFGDEMWISKDEETIQRVMRALEPEDGYAKSREGNDAQREEWDRRQLGFERLRAELKDRHMELESRIDALRRELKRRDLAGESTKDLREEQAALEGQKLGLIEEEEEMARQRSQMSREMESGRLLDKISFAERDKIHQRVMEQIVRIGKRAIEEGNAERYIP